jgi:hypothetical protein
MKFKTNWRVGFFTPNEHKDLDLMPVGKTRTVQFRKQRADGRSVVVWNMD